METNFQPNDAYKRAKKRVEKLKGFYTHLAVYIIVNIFIIVLHVKGNWNNPRELWEFGTFSTAIFWGIGLLAHAVSVFGQNFFLGKNWEDEKLKKFMEDEQRKQNQRF